MVFLAWRHGACSHPQWNVSQLNLFMSSQILLWKLRNDTSTQKVNLDSGCVVFQKAWDSFGQFSPEKLKRSGDACQFAALQDGDCGWFLGTETWLPSFHCPEKKASCPAFNDIFFLISYGEEGHFHSYVSLLVGMSKQQWFALKDCSECEWFENRCDFPFPLLVGG